MHGETTEIIAFKRKLTGQMIQLKAGARSANTAPAEKRYYYPSSLGYQTIGNVVHR